MYTGMKIGPPLVIKTNSFLGKSNLLLHRIFYFYLFIFLILLVFFFLICSEFCHTLK